MSLRRYFAITLSLLCLALSLGAQTNYGPSLLPPIGKWMLIKHGNFAHWLGQHYAGKEIREPINVIIIDSVSQTRDQAIKQIIAACKLAGYEEEFGHSSGYFATIDNITYAQIPNNQKMAFSNHDFYMTNNHGRIFGPDFYNNSFIFTGAFSRESFSFFSRVHHLFVSFTAARDDFSQKLGAVANYHNIGLAFMDNSLDTDNTTTGDHDGYAVILAYTR